MGETIYNNIFSKYQKADVTKDINTFIISRAKECEWNFTPEEKCKLVFNIVHNSYHGKKIDKMVVESGINDSEIDELLVFLYVRVHDTLMKLCNKEPTEKQEKYYLSLCEQMGEIASYKTNHKDISIEIERLIKRVETEGYVEGEFRVRDIYHLFELRHKHYNHECHKEKSKTPRMKSAYVEIEKNRKTIKIMKDIIRGNIRGLEEHLIKLDDDVSQ